MSAMQTEVFEAFRAIDVPEDKALRAAAALASAFARAEKETAVGFTKRDGAIDRLSGEVASQGTRLSAEIVALDNKLSSAVAALDNKLSSAVTALDNKLTIEVAALDQRITTEVAALNQRITSEIAGLNAKIVKLDGDVALLKWMVGFNIAMLVTLLFRSFTH